MSVGRSVPPSKLIAVTSEGLNQSHGEARLRDKMALDHRDSDRPASPTRMQYVQRLITNAAQCIIDLCT